MKISGVGARIPSRRVNNEEILNLISRSGHSLSESDQASYLEQTLKVLTYSGAETRYWLDAGESPWQLVRGSLVDALQSANLEPGDVDVFIYASVSRGFLEPAEAYAVAHGAGINPKQCFDVIEACNSFSRAAQLAQLMLKAGEAANVVITVAEFCVNGSNYVLPNFAPSSLGDLAWSFPSYTLGEVAATVVLTPEERDWRFRIHTDVGLAPSCQVALPHGPVYSPDMFQTSSQTEIFRSFGQPMHLAAVEASRMLWNQMEKANPELVRAPILFPHAPSRKLCEDFSRNTGYPLERIFQLYTRFGNVGSASVPLGVYVAMNEGHLKRGDTVLCMVGAAGMSFMLYDLTF